MILHPSDVDALSRRPFANRLGIRAGEPTIRQIQDEACDTYRVTIPELLSHRRDAFVVRARHWAMAECVKRTSLSLPTIGRAFKRDHTVVLYAVQKLRDGTPVATLAAEA